MNYSKLACNHVVFRTNHTTLTEIEYIVEEKDIGVVIDSKLEFENHIHQKISKASSIMAPPSVRHCNTEQKTEQEEQTKI